MADQITYRPKLTQAGRSPTCPTTAINEYGDQIETAIAGEFPLTIYLDRREIVTLMTIGGQPEALTLGYLKNQNLVTNLSEIESIQVDWETQAVAVTRFEHAQKNVEEKLAKRTVTTGCGQGTVFGDIMQEIDKLKLQPINIKQSALYALLKNISNYNEVYKNAGAVHGCALCDGDQIIDFIEDVGRHNAVDAIAGNMWLNGVTGENKIFYTTGRLTSEMVIKVTQMGISVLLSRSGMTQMGLDLAKQTGVTLIARAKGRHFLIFNGHECIELDAKPPPRRTFSQQ